MHLSRLIKAHEFTYSIDGHAATFDDVLPSFGRDDRVGIVTRSPGSAIRAAGPSPDISRWSTLLLAAVGRFYEFRLAGSDYFYAYPDFYVFHVDRLQGYHGMIDVWPEHKEVVVDAAPESIVRAVNDRGVTHLLVEDVPPSHGLMARETVEGLRARLRVAYTFVPPDSRDDRADVLVHPSTAAVRAIREGAAASGAVVGADIAKDLAARAPGPQAFRRVGVDEVLSVLSGYGESDAELHMSKAYQTAHALTEADLDRHRYPV